MNVKRARSILALLALLLALVPGTALAHKPLWGTREISDPTVSWAVYTELTDAGAQDTYHFTALTGTPLYTQMTLPAISSTAEFRPWFVLSGPCLPPADAQLPVAIPAGDGAIVVPPPAEATSFFEPFTQTRYRILQTLRLDAPCDGDYSVTVYSPSGQTGKYVLAIGEREAFGLRDVLLLPVTWWRVHAYFGDWLLLTAVVVVPMLAIAGAVAYRRRSRSRGRARQPRGPATA